MYFFPPSYKDDSTSSVISKVAVYQVSQYLKKNKKSRYLEVFSAIGLQTWGRMTANILAVPPPLQDRAMGKDGFTASSSGAYFFTLTCSCLACR